MVSFYGDLVSFLVECVDALLEDNLEALNVLVILSQLVVEVLNLFILLQESFLLCFALIEWFILRVECERVKVCI